MEAVRRGIFALAVCLLSSAVARSEPLLRQNVRTQNFLVYAEDPRLARTVANQAEKFRAELAKYWLGKPLPAWPTPCPIEVVAGPHLAAQGATTYSRSPVGNFQMRVVGTPERILDSVLPHEVTHTVMATHFGRPLPRWADEGICTTVEHSEERDKHEVKLREYLSNRRGIAMNRLFLLTEYPSDMLPMYAQGYSVCRFLIEQSGPRQFIAFLEDYMRRPSWTANVQEHYGYNSLKELQDQWLSWVASGSGSVDRFVANPNMNPARPGAPVASLASAAAVRTASGEGASWYGRQNPGTARDQIAPRQSDVRPVASDPGKGQKSPGSPSGISSGYYSVAQPRAEQSYDPPVSRGSAPARIYR